MTALMAAVTDDGLPRQGVASTDIQSRDDIGASIMLPALPARTWINIGRKPMAIPAAIENVRGIKIAINMTGMATAMSSQSRSRAVPDWQQQRPALVQWQRPVLMQTGLQKQTAKE